MHKYSLALIHTPDPQGKVHSGIIKVFDSENKRVVVQWAEEDGFIRSETVRDKDVVHINPRASIRIERIKVVRSVSAAYDLAFFFF